MSDIYDLHSKAFNRVSAYVVLHNGERVATIAFKFPADGAGRLYCYVHWLGTHMVRSFATGYGCDKRSASCASASHRLPFPYQFSDPRAPRYLNPDTAPLYDRFRFAAMTDNGRGWDRNLEDAGFAVLQAV
jgi:hypothetical protein